MSICLMALIVKPETDLVFYQYVLEDAGFPMQEGIIREMFFVEKI